MSRSRQISLNLLLLILFGYILARTAWISDDAYITFRSVENFVSGYGMGYNPYVRVQSFTHPLWMLIISLGYFFQTRVFHISLPGGLYFLTITLSMILACVSVWIGLNKVAVGNRFSAIVFCAGLILSKAFVDYSTSGLESPLTHLLVILFLWVYQSASPSLLLLSLISGLISFNRLDLFLVVLPPLLGLLWSERNQWRKNIPLMLLGFSPLILWEAFCLFYYGFLFPNTAYAKLNTNIADMLLLKQGINYLGNSLRWDPITLLVILIAGFGLFYERAKGKVLIYVGAILYICYIVKIGGDFMSGRFLSVPFLIALVLISNFKFIDSSYFQIGFSLIFFVNVFLGFSPLVDRNPVSSKNTQNYIDQNGIADERMVYFQRLGLFGQDIKHSDNVGSPFAGRKWIYTGIEHVLVRGATGMPGYVKGPNIYVIDKYALTDPLLSRLPVTSGQKWRVGHYERAIPEGYRETLLTGENQIVNLQLAFYYDKLSILTSGPLWKWDRIIEIWKFNTGQYDHLMNLYLQASISQ